MASWQKLIAISLTASSLFVGSVADLSKPASAGEPLFDKNCHHYPRNTQNFKGPTANEATYIFKTLDFLANGQKYFLTVLRANDGSGVFCISQSEFWRLKRLSDVENIQAKYIYQIVQENKNDTNFLITLREGNGRTARTAVYKLNLKNPNRPVLARVNR